MTMSTQRCYCLTNHHGALEMREGPIPVPKDGEVLVKVTGAGVCHSDLHIWEGFYDLGGGKKIELKDRGIALPMTLGHEIAGEIVKAGPHAKGVKIGASVVVYPWIGCGTCAVCKSGDENICLKARSLGVFTDGGYARYVIVPDAKYCIDIAGLDAPEAAPLACSGVTTYSAIKKFGSRIHHEPIVIMGAGGLGHMALKILSAMGGQGSIMVDIDKSKRDAAVAAGALKAIDGSAPDAAKQIIDATGGGARMILDLVGAASTVNLAIATATRGTEIVVVGLYGGEINVSVPLFPLRPLAIRGSYVGNLAELTEIVGLAKSGKLKLVPVQRRPLDEANAALMDLKDGKIIGRVVLVP
jgi:D-arabinose 1-dehydrogenase-like Zn-dependent alcohol dehydrogenase